MIVFVVPIHATMVENVTSTEALILQIEDMPNVARKDRTAALALTWILVTLGSRILMVMQRLDRFHAGLLPVFLSLVSGFGFVDTTWVQAYASLRTNMVGAYINIDPGSVEQDGLEHSGGMAWLRLTCQDGLGSLWSRLYRRRNSATTPPAETSLRSPYLHQAQTWFRCPRALVRFATVLEWKYFFLVHPPRETEIPDGFRGTSQPHRIPDHNGEDFRIYRLDTQDQQEISTINNLLNDTEAIVLVYGLNVMLIEGGRGPPAQLEENILRRALVAFWLSLTVVAGVTIHSPNLWPCVSVALIPVCLQHWTHRTSVDQRRFFRHVSTHVEQIECASRHLVRQLVHTSGLTDMSIDVRLCYNNIQTWCRCDPTPPGDPAETKTWVEIMIPSRFPMYGRFFELYDVLLHSLLPWGHTDNWSANLTYASVTLWVSSMTLWGGCLGILLYVPAGWLMPRTRFGDGDPWNLAWYVWACQIMSRGAVSAVLQEWFDKARELFSLS